MYIRMVSILYGHSIDSYNFLQYTSQYFWQVSLWMTCWECTLPWRFHVFSSQSALRLVFMFC